VIYAEPGLPVKARLHYDKRSPPRAGVHLAEGQSYNGPTIIFQGGEDHALGSFDRADQFL